MHQARRRAALAQGQERSANLISRWVDEHLGLISGLVALREMGAEAEPALNAVLRLREPMIARLSWELVETLSAGGEQTLEFFLLREIPLDLLERARFALWGRSSGAGGR